MHERDLRALLLVRAVEDTDGDGALIPLADREAATRETLRAARGQEVLRQDGTLTADGTRMLVDRAQRLTPALVARHPALEKLLAIRPARHWLLQLVPLGGLITGLALSALDPSRRINILAFPLVGLILWNLAIYAWLLVQRFTGRATLGPTALAGRLIESMRARRFASLRVQTARIHAPLAAALQRFGREWQAAVLPILVAAGRTLMHVTAVCVAVGLIAGMYVRGLVLRYEAGWESTFLGAKGVQALLRLVYGPASAVTDIALPATTDAVAALEWSAGSSGVNAGPWIHLIAVTAVLYVVLPRLVLAGLAGFDRARRERNADMPARLEGYARRALGAAGGRVSGLPTSVVTYAYELDPHARDGLTRLVRLAFGAASVVDVDAPIRYGDEDDYAAGRGAESAGLQGCLVGVMNLGATPEAENHGIVLTSWRDRVANARGSARLLFVVDEGPYLRRLGGDPSLAARVEERRELWRSFARACGVPVLLTDLGRVDGTATANAETIAALNVALWPADHR